MPSLNLPCERDQCARDGQTTGWNKAIDWYSHWEMPPRAVGPANPRRFAELKSSEEATLSRTRWLNP